MSGNAKNCLMAVLLAMVMVLMWGCATAPRQDYSPLYEPARESKDYDESSGFAQSQDAQKVAAAPASRIDVASEEPRSSQMAWAGQATELTRPQIIKTATLSMRVDDIANSMKSLENMTLRYQGIITNQYLSLAEQGSHYRTGSLQIRVPQERLQGFLDELPQLGVILNQQVTGQDVGAEIVDNEARIRNLRSEEEALQAIMRRAGKIPEVLEVSRELARVRGQIEQTQGRLNYLRQQVAFSTVSISLAEKAVTSPVQTKPKLGNVILNSYNQSVEALYDLLITSIQSAMWLIIYFIPLVLVLGLVGFALWKIAQRLLGAALAKVVKGLSQISLPKKPTAKSGE